MEWDPETSLYQTWFRKYDVNQGRWMSVDPLAGSTDNPQSLDRYVYVLDDPTNLIDPLGLICSQVCTASGCGPWICDDPDATFWRNNPSLLGFGFYPTPVGMESINPTWLERLLDWVRPIEPLGPAPGPQQPVPPVSPCYITGGFNPPSHPAIDITTAAWRGFPGYGTVVSATVTGVVSDMFTRGTPGGRANFVSTSAGGLVSSQSHVTAPSGFVVGMSVYAGMPLGVTDRTGNQTNAHVDLRVRPQDSRQYLNPASLLPGCSPATPQSRR